MKLSDDSGAHYSYSYTVHSDSHEFYETPKISDVTPAGETIPAAAFAHASTLQAASRYLVDVKGYSFAKAGQLLGRSQKTIWSSYHQTSPLPQLEESIPVPVSIFSGARSPLEALVLYLKSLGLRNVEIASTLRLDPKTTWTAAKRGEARA